MSSYASALLDELMGRNRDSNPFDISNKRDHWSDEKVCKYYLCGFCPHDLFVNTKADLGKCPKLHDDDFRASYYSSTRCMKMGYEKEFIKFLVSLANDVDRRIKRGEQRLVLNNQNKQTPQTSAGFARQKKIEELSDIINGLVSKSELLGSQGNVDEAKDVMDQCEKLQIEKQSLVSIQSREQMLMEQETGKTMEVCGICGAFLVVGDPQQRQDEHQTGKLHMGYLRIKEYLKKNHSLTDSLRLEPSTSSSISKPSAYTSINLANDLNNRAYLTNHISEKHKSRSRSREKKSRKKSRSKERRHKSYKSDHKDHKHHHHHHHHRHNKHHKKRETPATAQ